jgi:predicted dehydrogenase
MPHAAKTNRREFMQRTAGVVGASAAFPYIVPSRALGRDGAVPPSDRVTVGSIGVGNMGQAHLRHFIYQPEVQLIAASDPNRWRREQAQHLVNGEYNQQVCAAYNDFRELLARKDIDAVCISTLDSWHVLHALAAVRAGKDVYLEKPMGMSIDEIKLLRQEVQQHGRVFQFGTQQRSSKEFRFACELVRNGRIGKVHTIKVGVHSGAASGTGPKAIRPLNLKERRERDLTDERTGLAKIIPEPVPEWLDYEMWLGPAPYAPYTTARLTAPHWFHISDYSQGYVGGWGIHHIDIAQWGNATDLTGPVSVIGKAVWPNDDALCDNPVSWDTHFEYANGVHLHFTGSGQGFQGERHGITFVGPDGWVYVDRGILETEPKSLMQSTIGPNEEHLPVSDLHEQNFIECVKSRGRTICPIDVAVRSDTVCQLAWITFRLHDRKLAWDPEKETFAADADAVRLMRRSLRSPWKYAA